ncbi:MAG: MATE family efflux transporter [Desulfobacterales bacterium]
MIVWGKWRKKSRYREVATVCFPLVMSMAAVTVMEFTDRIFLSNYSVDAIAAALPAGIAALLVMTFFSGVAGYTSVFIAQYCGAGAYERIGSTLWQGIYFSIFSGVLAAVFSSLIALPLFTMAGHAPEVQHLERIYFKILCWGSVFHIGNHALSAFFTGRGITRAVMVINGLGMAFNIPLDYVLINGVWVFPELGITGAAIATVASWGFITLLFSLLIFTRLNQKKYLVHNVAFDSNIFARLMRFGVPSALQISIDIFAFTFFVFIVGRIGKNELAISNIVLSINSLAFMPAMGFSYGISTLVGQALGRGKPEEARHATWSATHILMAYTFAIDFLFVFAPNQVLSLFISSGGTMGDYVSVMDTGRNLLQIVAVYVFMDALYMSFSGVLKGAGDTNFIMWNVAIVSLFVMIFPIYIGIEIFHMGIYYAWLCVLLFVGALFIVSFFRYHQKKWQKMLVVEAEIVSVQGGR